VTSKTYKTTIVREGSMCRIPVTFDPRAVFGRIRVPVKVTLNGYTFRSTMASMGGLVGIPLRASNREAAGLEGTETLSVRLDLDTVPRTVTPPPDLVRALKAPPSQWKRWKQLSYTRRKELVDVIEAAKKPETRARRIGRAVEEIRTAPPRQR
jgi:hypothetical protein